MTFQPSRFNDGQGKKTCQCHPGDSHYDYRHGLNVSTDAERRPAGEHTDILNLRGHRANPERHLHTAKIQFFTIIFVPRRQIHLGSFDRHRTVHGHRARIFVIHFHRRFKP
jgi:hypothetical protein